MPVDHTLAEEYELPSIRRRSSSSDSDRDGSIERDAVVRKHSADNERDLDLDQIPLLPQEGEEMIGKGTKVEQLIARVCAFHVGCQVAQIHS